MFFCVFAKEMSNIELMCQLFVSFSYVNGSVPVNSVVVWIFLEEHVPEFVPPADWELILSDDSEDVCYKLKYCGLMRFCCRENMEQFWVSDVGFVSNLS